MMILTNRTRWNTADLETVILRGLDEAGVAHGREHVHIVYGRSFSGFCYFPWSGPLPKGTRSRKHTGARMVLRVPRPSPHLVNAFDAPLFAWLVRHELGHWRGLRHPQMHALMRWREEWEKATRPLPIWAEGLTVRLDEDQPKPRKVVDLTTEREKRLTHARTMLVKAVRRAKLTATLAKKWKRKVDAMDRYAAKAAFVEKQKFENRQ